MAIDTQGNFWFFDLSQSKKYLKFYNSDSGQVQQIEIEADKMVGVTIESLTDLTFVDGYIYVRGDTGVLVWIGDLSRGYFKTVIENKPGQ